MKKNYIPVLILFLDAIILGLVFPLIPALILNPKYEFAIVSSSDRDLIYSLAVTVFPFFSILGMYCLGRLSDKYGRSFSLLLGIGGKTVAILLIFAAVILKECSILVLTQIIFGFSAGIFAVALAAVIDKTPKQELENKIRWPVYAHIIGLTIGSLAGGLIIKSHTYKIFSSLSLALCLSLASLAIIALFFKNSLQTSPDKKSPTSINSLLLLLKDRSIIKLSFAYFFYLTGWGIFMLSIKYIFVNTFSYTAVGLSILSAVNGGVTAIMLFVILPLILLYFASLKRLFNCLFILIIAAGIIMITISNNIFYIWFGNIIIHLLSVFVSVQFIAEFSGRVNQKVQGTIMGYSGALTGIALTLSGIIAVFVLKDSGKDILYFAFCFFVASCLVYKKFYKK